MSDRELLEKQALELGVEVAEGISDADLLKLLEKAKAAKARADLETRATALGVDFAPSIGDKKLAERVAKAEAEAAGSTQDAPPAPEGDFTVLCALAEGRRRAGRRWPGGVTNVPANEMTDAMLVALVVDPMFQVTPTTSE